MDTRNMTLEWPVPGGRVEWYSLHWRPVGPGAAAGDRNLSAPAGPRARAALDGLQPGRAYTVSIAAHSHNLSSDVFTMDTRTRRYPLSSSARPARSLGSLAHTALVGCRSAHPVRDDHRQRARHGRRQRHRLHYAREYSRHDRLARYTYCTVYTLTIYDCLQYLLPARVFVSHFVHMILSVPQFSFGKHCECIRFRSAHRCIVTAVWSNEVPSVYRK